MISIKDKINNLISSRESLLYENYKICVLPPGITAWNPDLSKKRKQRDNPPIPRKFDQETVEQIRYLRTQGWTYEHLARNFKTCKFTIHHIIRRKGAYANFSRDF